jgi:hypothetical protein
MPDTLEPKEPRVFLAFAAPDHAAAERLRDRLKRAGIAVFPCELPTATLDRGLTESDFCLLLWSAHMQDHLDAHPADRADPAAALARELGAVDQAGAFLLVLRLDHTPMPTLLAPRRSLDGSGRTGADAAVLTDLWQRDWECGQVLRAPATFAPPGPAREDGGGGGADRSWVEAYVYNDLHAVHHLVRVPPEVSGRELRQIVAEQLLLRDRVALMAGKVGMRLRYDLIRDGEVIADAHRRLRIVDGTVLELAVRYQSWNHDRTAREWVLRGDTRSSCDDEAAGTLQHRVIRALFDRALGHLAPGLGSAAFRLAPASRQVATEPDVDAAAEDAAPPEAAGPLPLTLPSHAVDDLDAGPRSLLLDHSPPFLSPAVDDLDARAGTRTETDPETRVAVHVTADLPSRVQVGKVVSVVCHLSRAAIEVAAGRVGDQGRIAADPSRDLTLHLLPRTNVEVVKEDRTDVPVPAAGRPQEVFFDVRPTHTGTCRVWVVVRQGPLPLLTLELEACSTADPPAGQATPTSTRAEVELGDSAEGLEDIPWLSVVEIDRGPDTVYRFDLRSTTLNVMVTFESAPLRNRAAYVENLFRRIESRWLSTAGDLRSFQEELREFGGELLTELFPEPLQKILWDYRDRLRQLVVLSSEPFIPWELVHLKEPGGPLPDGSWFLAELGLVRWLYCGDGAYPTQSLHARDHRVRVLCPDYVDPALRLTHTPGERQFLIDRLGARPVTPREREVREMLRAGDFDVLHFAGHGLAGSADLANARILLEGRREHGSYVRTQLSATTVEQQAQLAAPNGDRPLVVLNACQVGRAGARLSSLGGFAHAFLNRGAGAFISSLWSVGDEPASIFVTTLYEQLLQGSPMSEAVTQARTAAKNAGDGTWLAYAVYAHPQARLHLT